MRDSLFSEKTLQTIQKIRKIFLRCAVWILIAELALGAILILTEGWDNISGRIQGTFLILASILFVSVNNFVRIEKGNKLTQIFALAGFVSNLIWGIFAVLLMWEVVPFVWTEEVMRTSRYSDYTYPVTKYHMTIYAKIMLISSFMAVTGFWVSNITSIKDTIKLVKPLKITSTICLLYLLIFGTVATLVEPDFEDIQKLVQLAGFAGLAFTITTLAAYIISRTNKKKMIEPKMASGDGLAQSKPKTEAELRAEIEERVRREMMEEEIRAKMKAERSTGGNISENKTDESDGNNNGTPEPNAV